MWDEEDQALRRDVPDSASAKSKRLIGSHNPRRNDAIGRIDDQALTSLPKLPESARLHSETVGTPTDRLSILSLKMFHTDWQTRRADADANAAHHAMSCERLSPPAGTAQTWRADWMSSCGLRGRRPSLQGVSAIQDVQRSEIQSLVVGFRRNGIETANHLQRARRTNAGHPIESPADSRQSLK